MVCYLDSKSFLAFISGDFQFQMREKIHSVFSVLFQDSLCAHLKANFIDTFMILSFFSLINR